MPSYNCTLTTDFTWKAGVEDHQAWGAWVLYCHGCCCPGTIAKTLVPPVTKSTIHSRPYWHEIACIHLSWWTLLASASNLQGRLQPNPLLAPTTQNRFPAASSWRSESCLEKRVNSWQEAIKVSFIHSHYCFYVFAIMFIDMFERSTSCSSVQLPVKMGHLSRNKPRSF